MTPMLRREANEEFRRTLTRTIILPLVMLALLAATLFWLITNLLASTAWVEYTDVVIAEANELQSIILDQETGFRGYLLTDRDIFLEPYTRALAVIDDQFASLKTLVADNPAQQARVEQIQQVNREWQAFAAAAIDQKQQTGEVASLVQNGRGKQLVDQMRAINRAFIDTEETLRVERTATVQRVTQGVLAGSVLATLLLGLLLAYTTRRALVRLSHTYNTVLARAEHNEQELYTQREWFRSTLSSIGDAVIATDVHGNVSFMNDVAATLTGWTSDQALGKPLVNVFTTVHERTREPAEIPVERVLREGIVVGLTNHTALVRRDGTSIPIDDSASPVRDAGGALVGAVLVFRDITERYRVENEMRDSETKYRDLAESMPMVVWTAEADGNVTYFNPAWYTYIGHPADGSLGWSWQDVIHPEDWPITLERWTHALQSGELYEIQYRWRGQDGQYRWFLGRGVPVRDASGAILQWIGTGTDIDDQKRFSQRLSLNERRYRDLSESLPILLWTAQADGTPDYYNRRWLDFSGLSLDQVLNDNWADSIHPQDLPHAAEQWLHALATGEPVETEYRFRRYDGQYRWFLGRVLPVRDPEGRLVQWISTSVDIDERKRAEQELAESATQFRQITEAMPQIVWTTLPDGYHTYFNQRWYDYTGTSLEEARGDGWSRILHPDDYERTLQVWGHSLRTGDPYEIEYRFCEAATGEYRWFLARAAAIRDSDGAISEWFGTCTDIDSQKRAEETLIEQAESLARATTALEERNRELDQFAYVTSHDLKAPLRGIANLSQWIEEDLGEQVTEDIKKQLELLRGRVHRMEGLIDGILQFSRIGRVKGSIERVDLNEVLADVIDLLAPPPEVTIVIQPDLPMLQTERVHIQQVFGNLIGNAIKHSAGRTNLQIEVTCADRGAAYEFAVRDNGPGIAPQYHDKVFMMFQTLASRDKVEGTGLGLSLVKKTIELHGGRIWLESTEGSGATFRFLWPKREAGERKS